MDLQRHNLGQALGVLHEEGRLPAHQGGEKLPEAIAEADLNDIPEVVESKQANVMDDLKASLQLVAVKA